MLPIHVFDFVLDALTEQLAPRRPEQGGALLGLHGRDVVTAFVHDAAVPGTQVEYQPTEWLLAGVAQREQLGSERFKGVVHSHPPGMPVPSGQDQREYARTLASVTDLGRCLAPIVTHDPHSPLERHELRLGRQARISFFVAVPGAERAVVQRAEPVVVPVGLAVARTPVRFEPERVRTGALSGIGGVRFPFALEQEGQELFVTPDFPVTPPLLLTPDADGGPPTARVLPWDLAVEPLLRLAHACLPRPRVQTRPQQPRPGESAAPVRSVPRPARPFPPTDADSAEGGYRLRRFFGLALPDDVDESPDELFARTGGLLSPGLHARHVVVVGAGAVGSYLAEVLVRSGVGRITLVDPDPVEPSDLGRSPFVSADVGSPKAAVTARRLRAITSTVRVTALEQRVEDLGAGELPDLLDRADLLVAATDDNATQQRLNQLCHGLGRPAVFVGLYDGIAGGEVVLTAPGSPCWSCSTGAAREVLGRLRETPRTDYNTGRLEAVTGLLPDLHQVGAAAAKIALSLLHPEGAKERIAGFLVRPLEQGRTVVLIGNEPDYWFFPQVFEDVLGQHAHQSLWLRPASRPDCPVCGTDGRGKDG